MSWDILPKGNLQYYLQKLKAKFDLKVDKEAGKDLSTNDFTTTEKNKLAGIEAGAQVNPTIDSALSDSSTNAVQNKVVKGALDNKADSDSITGSKSVNGNPIAISDAANAYAEEVIANIEPIQDLHGYDHPWVGGAGKNKLQNNVTTRTRNGVTITVNDNGSMVFNGTSTEWFFEGMNYVQGALSIPVGNWIFNGGASGIYISVYVDNQKVLYTYGTGDKPFTVPSGATTSHIRFEVNANTTLDNVKVYPMLRLATEADPTFAPYSNISPITGISQLDIAGCGKNLYDKSNGVLYGYPTASYTWQQNSSDANELSIMVKLKEGETYTAKRLMGANSIFRIQASAISALTNGQSLQDIDSSGGNNTTEKTFTVPTGYPYVIFYVRNTTNISSLTIEQIINAFQVEFGSSATSYKPYTPNNHTISLGRTVYGGKLNVQTGELVVDRAKIVLDGTQTLINANWNEQANTVGWLFAYEDTRNKTVPFNITPNLLSDKYKALSYNEIFGHDVTGVGVYNSDSVGLIVKQSDKTLNTASLVNAYLSNNPIEVCYELATQITYHLTPEQVKLLKGYNYITTNAETLELTYQPDNVLGEILGEAEGYTDRAIDSLGDQYIKNDGVEGNSTIITSYSSVSNHFTAPTDGYIKFSVPLNYTDRYVTVYFLYPDLEHIWLIKKIAGNNSYSFEDAIFVKKGTICMVYENSVDATVYFVS